MVEKILNRKENIQQKSNKRSKSALSIMRLRIRQLAYKNKAVRNTSILEVLQETECWITSFEHF